MKTPNKDWITYNTHRYTDGMKTRTIIEHKTNGGYTVIWVDKSGKETKIEFATLEEFQDFVDDLIDVKDRQKL